MLSEGKYTIIKPYLLDVGRGRGIDREINRFDTLLSCHACWEHDILIYELDEKTKRIRASLVDVRTGQDICSAVIGFDYDDKWQNKLSELNLKMMASAA